MNDFDISVAFIKGFVDKYFDGNVDGFLDFPLSRLQEDKDFGCRGRSFDSDDTEIMRHLYVVLFADVWPDLSLESLRAAEFRGDTLNTYNTMFGVPNEASVHPGLDRFQTSAAICQEVAAFHDRYTFIGNMAPLPNLRVNGKSINTYRGTHGQWHDLYQGEDGFRKLVDGLMLNDYVDANYQPILSSKGFYFWKKGLTSEEYSAEAARYVNFSTTIINHRSRLMVDKLKKIWNGIG